MTASSPHQQQDAAAARRLLIELLSYQFAFPVRWIETQEHILANAGNSQRVIELGPSQVLTPMAKKTAASTFALHDTVHGVERQFLSHNENTDQVYYNYASSGSSPSAPSQDTPATSEPAKAVTSSPAPATAPVAAPVAPPPAAAGPVAHAVDDQPLSAADILRALTAQKLKIPFDSLPGSKSVRELSDGKSTLQNELIGDFGAEFGNVPDGAEDLPLDALGGALQGKFSGQPGKQASALISKMVSAKMPAGFNANAMKSHMESYWGLPVNRQQTVLALAITVEPATRLGSADAAKEWLDGVVKKYGAFAGLSLAPGGGAAAGGAGAGPSVAMVDTKALEEEQEARRKLIRDQIVALKKNLGDATNGDASKIEELETLLEEASEQADRLASELDSDFSTGIKSQFNASKARVYNSWWNWAREDLVRLWHDMAAGKVSPDASETISRLALLRNRLDASCDDLIDFHASTKFPQSKDLSQTSSDPVFRYTTATTRPSTTIANDGEIKYAEVPRTAGPVPQSYSELVRKGSIDGKSEGEPFVHIKSKEFGQWALDDEQTNAFLSALDTGMLNGLSFAGKTALVTGAGAGSIGAEVVRGLIQGGAQVLVTTSREPSSVAAFYQQMYRQYGARGSSLEVVPFNAASKRDVEQLVEYIYSGTSKFADLDYIIPFAAIPQAGQADNLKGKSELALRAMLTNVVRLFGAVKAHKESRKYLSRPTNILLPLSPNHGTFGGDGLYGESKLALETLFNRWQSEHWANLLTVTGVVIGWTRGTGLMSSNDTSAAAIEQAGALTFSQAEMAFNILALMAPQVVEIAEDGPVYADCTGRLNAIPDLKKVLSRARKEMLDESRLRRAIVEERKLEQAALQGKAAKTGGDKGAQTHRARARLNLDFPQLNDYKNMTAGTADMQGLPDLERTICVVGYSELGPWGSARTRWEIENAGMLSAEGLVELAWMMGLVKHHVGDVNGQAYAGWVDAETKEPVHEADFRTRYEKTILTHTGLRFIEPEGLGGYDPHRKEALHEVVLEEDLPPFEASSATAEAFARRHGSKAVLEKIPDSDDVRIHIKAGTSFHVPKAIQAERWVAGQLPKGFDPVRYGIPQEIISQVDPIVVYALCCLSEAVLMAGLSDPLELYKHIHVADLANCLGTGCGSLLAMRSVYRERYMDRPVPNDILQETYQNIIGAWTNMLFLASSGPIRSPTGTCATAIESLDAGCEVIRSGRAKVAIVGGSDDFQEEMSYEFGNMKATCNTRDELAKGRTPREMSRPTASSRAGFVEAAGCGVQIIMTADLALRMGLPIYGIVGYTHMAGDKVGRSVPAPGQGVLTAAREPASAAQSPLLNLAYRKEMLTGRLEDIERAAQRQTTALRSAGADEAHLRSIRVAADVEAKDARYMWINDVRKQDPSISPIRAALTAWNLTVDDIQVATFHGTSTKANEKNESNVVNTQMNHLGRTKGNPLLVICQKHLTGHSKGASGAFMLNGGLQVLQSGMVPGNRNADNLDEALRPFEHLVFPNAALQTARVDAFLLTSFGFGQKGGLAVIIHPRHLFAAIDENSYGAYRATVEARNHQADALFARGVVGNCLFRAKEKSPWEAAGEQRVFLDPAARVSGAAPSEMSFVAKDLYPAAKELSFKSFVVKKDTVKPEEKASAFLQATTAATGASDDDVLGVGVDIEQVSAVPAENANFVTRNFSAAEQGHCASAADPRASFAGRWAAKEAVFKSIRTKSLGGGAAMSEIEVLSDDGVPRVVLHGKAKDVAASKGIGRVEVSISHDDGRVIAVAAALRSKKD